MNINEIFAQVNKNTSEYDLGTSDFAVTIDSPKNGTVAIQLMQRNTVYNECILVGNQNVSSGTRGIVLFVSKAKYPCFIPIYFVNDSSIKIPDGSISIKTQKPINEKDFAQTDFINLRPYMMQNGLSEGVHFNFRTKAPESQQWGTKETIQAITNIIKEYWLFTKGSIKLIPGDIGLKQGGKFETHEGRGHATGRGIDMYLSNGLENNATVNKNNKQDIINLFDIMFSQGVVAILWIPPDFLKAELESRYKGKIVYASYHADHFHISFIGSPY